MGDNSSLIGVAYPTSTARTQAVSYPNNAQPRPEEARKTTLTMRKPVYPEFARGNRRMQHDQLLSASLTHVPNEGRDRPITFAAQDIFRKSVVHAIPD